MMPQLPKLLLGERWHMHVPRDTNKIGGDGEPPWKKILKTRISRCSLARFNYGMPRRVLSPPQGRIRRRPLAPQRRHGRDSTRISAGGSGCGGLVACALQFTIAALDTDKNDARSLSMLRFCDAKEIYYDSC